MTEDDWVTVGQFSDPLSAEIVSKRLTEEGVPNRIWTPPRSGGECYVWVPPESLDTAKQLLAEPAVPEDELTALALKDPPPDDFEIPKSEPRAPESHAPDPIVRTSGTSAGWLIALVAIGLLGALFLYVPRTQNHEIARQRSPDGAADAVLMEVQHDAAGARGYKVCIQRAAEPKARALLACTEVAYLGGLSADSGPQPVSLVWPSSSQLEIRYASAASVHVYQPVFTWASARIGGPAVHIKAVQTGGTSPELQR